MNNTNDEQEKSLEKQINREGGDENSKHFNPIFNASKAGSIILNINKTNERNNK
uniref:Uncharacterized protein n=1 Tax=Nelumbo nucifera TaxID=4432 RepID=A0A822Y6Z6_NELNU|nr:TPA_asm: hypothetical protein HUJ06_028577 [Nelumbo nucifera]